MNEKIQIYKKAQEKNPQSVHELNQIYHCSDMTFEEYMSHLKLIAKG